MQDLWQRALQAAHWSHGRTPECCAPEGLTQSPPDVDPAVFVVVPGGQSSHAEALPPAEYVRRGL